jgi:hypothetical protein
MNLQRYVSTVYSEQIKEDDYKVLDEYLNKLYNNLTFGEIRKSYTKNYTPFKTNNPEVDYFLHNLLFEKVFENTIGNLMKTRKDSIVLFPVFQDIDSKNRLKDPIKSIYSEVLKEKSNEFTRDSSGNAYMFVPVFSDESETTEEYTERLTGYFNRWFDFIQEEKPIPTNVRPRKHLKFSTICYTVDHAGDFFTQYYKTKLKQENSKIVNRLLTTFLERLGLNNRSVVKDPITQLTPENSLRKFKADGKKESPKLDLFIEVLKKFVDVYKRTNDKEYLKSATASDLQSFFRIYYRVNNTDYVDNFNEIKPGSSNVYKVSYQNKVRIGYFTSKPNSSNYQFREYTGLTSQYKKEKSSDKPISEEELKEGTENPKDVIETKLFGSVLYFKWVEKGKYTDQYDGTIEFYRDLHIYEKYKWFDFRDMDGKLTTETTVRFYDNILFDKKSLIKFLKHKKEFSTETKLNREFLRINQSNVLFLEYVEYILNNMQDTNVFIETPFSFGDSLKSFIEKNKRSMVDIIFQTNTLLYLTHMHLQNSSSEETKITKNYKTVSYQYFDATPTHFDKILYDIEESKYCDKKTKCQLINEMKNNKNMNYAIVIVDVTKENIEVDLNLKAKTYCKKIRRTLKRQMQPLLRAIMPRWGGSRTRRRKYRH